MARTQIDFSKGLKRSDINQRNEGGHNSTWVDALRDLKTAVEGGAGEYDTFYCIGEFGNASGARTTIRSLAKRDDLPGEFELEAVVVKVRDPETGEVVYDEVKGKKVAKRTSELHAAVCSPAESVGDEGDVEPEAEDADDTEPEVTEDEAPATRRRGRK